MLQGLTACLSVVSTVLLVLMIMFLYKFKRSIPDIQQVLDDVGSSIGEQLTSIFEKPVVKASMTNLSKKSGEVRADKALRNRVAEKAIGSNVLLKKALDYFDVTPIEGLQLMNDPMIGPFIQRFIANLAQGGQGLLKGFNNPMGSSGRAPRGRGVPLMS